eukprot:TRINITY_DN518_c0_g1_i6.p1 TRINITY_DN518_c0_g1~~TRINITY_DN518_c0_g1_i6.p1  ORF type:complete len:291 (-),score=74.46 TRINITY_DN518_c0_g1_i6:90-923(-)
MCIRDSSRDQSSVETRKININMLNRFLSNIGVYRHNSVIFQYSKDLISLIIDYRTNEGEEGLDPQTSEILNSIYTTVIKLDYQPENIEEAQKLIKSALTLSDWRTRQRAIEIYQFFIYNHVYYLKVVDIDTISQLLIDENVNVRNAAFESISDLARLCRPQEIKQLITKYREIVESKTPPAGITDEAEIKKQRSIGVLALMAIVLGFPYEIEEWMDDAIKFILKHKKITKVVEERVKDFCSKFWKTHKSSQNFLGRELSEDNTESLRNVANPYSYFA